MGRGVLTGLAWGVLVSVVVLALVSLSMPLPPRPGAAETTPVAQAPAPEAPTPAAPDAPAAAEAEPPETPAPATPEAPAPTAPEAPAATTPEASAPTAPEAPTPTAPEAPGTAAPTLAPADEGAAAPAPRLPQIDAAPATGAPAAPAPEAAADRAPPLPETAPPPAPAVAAVAQAPAPAPLPTAPPPRFSTAADAGAGGTAPRRIAPPAQGDAPASIDTAPAPAPEPVAPPAAAVAEAPPANNAPEAAPAVTVTETEAAPAARLPQVTAPPAAAAMPGTQAGTGLPQSAGPGLSQRLPQAGLPPPAATPAPEPPAPAEVPAGALRANAAPFSAEPGQPLLAIVLIDEPDSGLDPAVLADIPFPVSFALDPLRPDAAARAAALRAAGFEVVILGAPVIPEGATAADVEVALAVARAALPQAVALIDDPAGRIQGDRPVLDATVSALAETGHGLIAYPRGLNAAEETARRTGLPAATVFRLLDDADQSAPVITRFLGRAAFAAGQEGAAVVVGRTRPDTVTALFSWALGGRTEGVALAPVSAVLARLSE
jgi:polysaccharide deacetylase 2 family uncharacterized protein YibQ